MDPAAAAGFQAAGHGAGAAAGQPEPAAGAQAAAGAAVPEPTADPAVTTPDPAQDLANLDPGVYYYPNYSLYYGSNPYQYYPSHLGGYQQNAAPLTG